MRNFCLSLLLLLTFPAGFCAAKVAATEPRLRIPQRFKQLYRQGNVTIEFYDAVTDPMEFQGHAAFDFTARCKFTYEYRFVVRRGKRYVRIQPKIQSIAIDMRHTVKIPKSHNTPELWDGKLMLHEMDHVAISTDPRIEMLLDHLFRSIEIVEKPVQRRGEVEASVLIEKVQAEQNARRDALLDLIKKCNVELDKITNHGNTPLEDRDAFFKNLYSKGGLDSHGFPLSGRGSGSAESKKLQTGKTAASFRWSREEPLSLVFRIEHV